MAKYEYTCYACTLTHTRTFALLRTCKHTSTMGSLEKGISFFNDVDFVAPDAIFELTQLYNSDPSPKKVNLGQGTYKNESGNPWIIPSVCAAREKTCHANHGYLPILDLPEFREQASRLVYGRHAAVVAENRVGNTRSNRTMSQSRISAYLPRKVGSSLSIIAWNRRTSSCGRSPAPNLAVRYARLYHTAILVEP